MGRTVNDAGVALVKEFEGFRAQAYLCPAGVWTIGYGHTRGVTRGDCVTKARAEALLAQDMAEAGAAVEQLITVPLTDNQLAALTSFVFNLGARALAASILRKKLNAGKYDAVPAELARWTKATDPHTGKKRELEGLRRRRAAEAALWKL
jgi:lysozyme